MLEDLLRAARVLFVFRTCIDFYDLSAWGSVPGWIVLLILDVFIGTNLSWANLMCSDVNPYASGLYFSSGFYGFFHLFMTDRMYQLIDVFAYLMDE